MFFNDNLAKRLINKKMDEFKLLNKELHDMSHKNIKLQLFNEFKKH